MPRPLLHGNIYIYVLIDPITWEVRYVGKTKNPPKRYDHHVSRKCNERYTGPKGDWIRELLDQGVKPIMDILTQCPDDVSHLYEYRYAKLFSGYDLTNSAEIMKETFQFDLFSSG
jgi:hypothetical protein